MRKGSLAGLVVFGLIWTALIGTVDLFIGRNLYRQVRALRFVETTGTITHSEVTRHRGSKGSTTYGVDIRYTYRVDGQPLSGERHRYGPFSSSSGSSWARDTVARYEVGKPASVFYDPWNPAVCLLEPGINGADLFILMAMMPFNAVMLGFWGGGLNVLLRRSRPRSTGGVRCWDDGRRIHARLPRYSPFVTALATIGLGAFASIFIVGISTGFYPRLGTMLLTWAALLGTGLGLAGWQWFKQQQGVADLVIDPVEQTVQLPVTFGRKQSRQLALADISAVTVEAIKHRSRKGGTTYTHAVTLMTAQGGEKLTDWHDPQRAEDFAAWLREKIQPTEPAAPPRKVSPQNFDSTSPDN